MHDACPISAFAGGPCVCNHVHTRQVQWAYCCNRHFPRVTSQMSHVPRIIVLCLTYSMTDSCVTWPVTHMNESCPTYQCVVFHVWMSRVPPIIESCPVSLWCQSLGTISLAGCHFTVVLVKPLINSRWQTKTIYKINVRWWSKFGVIEIFVQIFHPYHSIVKRMLGPSKWVRTSDEKMSWNRKRNWQDSIVENKSCNADSTNLLVRRCP